MTEINERLARFIWPDAKSVTVTENEMFVVFPRYKEPMGYRGLPFTESLDAQAMHVWPKLCAVDISKDPDLCHPDSWGALVRIEHGDKAQYVMASTPALASAQAIAKLLEGKA